MKRIASAVLLALLCLRPAFAAGTVTQGTVTPISGAGQVAGSYYLTFTWTADASAAAGETLTSAMTDANLQPVKGLYLYMVETNPGATAPTDNYDLVMNNSAGVDVMGGNLANRDTANTEIAYPATATPLIDTALTLVITNNSVNSATGTVKLYFTEQNGGRAGTGGAGGGATTALDNLAAVAINESLTPGTAGAIHVGSAAKPFGDIFFAGTSGTPGTNNFKVTGASTSGTRTLTAPDRSATIATTSGALTNNNCAEFDASGNIVDSGATCGGAGAATTALDNLAAVAINTSLLPASDGSADLGSAAKNFGTAYVRRTVPKQVTLTPGASVAPDASAGSIFLLELDQNTTLANPTNAVVGQTATFWFKQPAAGGPYTITLGSEFKYGTTYPTEIVLSTTASKWDRMIAEYKAAATWEVVAFQQGFETATSTQLPGISTLESQTGPTIDLATGTAGTNFVISGSGNTVTFDIPDASATARGLVTTGTQTIAGAKTLTGNTVLGTGSVTATTASALLVPASAAYAPTADGSIGYDTTQDAWSAGGAGAINGKIPRVLDVSFNGSDTVTASVTTSETNFAQNLVIPASYLIAGKVLRVTCIVQFTTSAGAPTMALRLKADTTTLAQLGAPTAPTSSMTTQGTGIIFYVQGTDAPGAAVDVHTGIAAQTMNGGAAARNNTAQPVAVATNAQFTLQLSAQWGANTAGNSVTLQQWIVEELN